MAETDDTNTNPEQPEQPEATGQPAPEGEASVPEGAATPETPDKNPEPQADSIAEAALKAARDAIAGLGDLASMASEPQSETPAESGSSKAGGAPEVDLSDPFAAAMAEAIEQEKAEKAAAASNAQPFDMPAFSSDLTPTQQRTIDLLSDVNLQVKIELGRTRMLVEDVLRLGEGAVVELDKLAGDPVDVYVNDRHVAKGEVLVLNDNFCVRINEIVSPIGDGMKKSRGVA